MIPNNTIDLNARSPIAMRGLQTSVVFFDGNTETKSIILLSQSPVNSTTAARYAVSLCGSVVPAYQKAISLLWPYPLPTGADIAPVYGKAAQGRERRTIISNRIIGAVSTGIGTCFGLLSILRVMGNVMLPPTCAFKAKKKRGGLSLINN